MTDLAYQDLPREELIDGQIVIMSPRPVWNHVSIAGNIYNIFFNYLRGKKCVPIQDGFDLFLTEQNRFVPDFMVVCDPEKIKKNGVYGAPDLVVEVLSPSTAKNDKIYKKELYAQCGVQEYWIIEPDGKSIELYHNTENGFILYDICTFHPDWMLEQMSEQEKAQVVTHFRCSLFDDLDISIEDIFYRTF